MQDTKKPKFDVLSTDDASLPELIEEACERDYAQTKVEKLSKELADAIDDAELTNFVNGTRAAHEHIAKLILLRREAYGLDWNWRLLINDILSSVPKGTKGAL